MAKLASPAAHAEPERDHDTGTEENEPVLQTQGLAIPARQLMICLRLATIFRSSEAQEALRAPGAFTVLRGLDLAEVGTAMQVLNTALPDHGCHLVAPNIYGGTVSKSDAERFTREADRYLDITTPILVLQPLDVALPDFFRNRAVASLAYAPITADILRAFLEATNRRPADVQAFRDALPDPSILVRFDTAQAVMSLRSGSALEVAHRLATLTGPAKEGPQLDRGFADSPALDVARRMVSDLNAWRRGEIGWSDCSHSVLFFRPPGTGKTWLARAMGNPAGIACIEGSFAEWQAAGHLGDMLREMRRTFAMARRAAPSILVIDEIDAAGSRVGDESRNRHYTLQVINAFLGEMNALATVPGVIVVGACNFPDRLDRAITRAGRFDIKV